MAQAGLNQPQVLEQLEARGFEEPQNWLSRIVNQHTGRIDFNKLVALAEVVGADPYELLTGEKRDAEATPFVTAMRQYEKELDDRGLHTVRVVAEHEVEEARKQREAAAHDDAYAEIKRALLATGKISADELDAAERTARQTLARSSASRAV